MNDTQMAEPRRRPGIYKLWRRLLLLLAVFGPATITAMADNDAGGVATYSIAGATLGYPILFTLIPITILLAVTQEMGMRLAVVTRKGLADLIREKHGVRVAMFMFGCLLIANMGTLMTELSAVKTTSEMLHIPGVPAVFAIVILSFIFITRGNYKLTEKIMLVTCVFFLAYVFSAIKGQPDWRLAISNLFYPHGVDFTPAYVRAYVIIGLSVLGTTITPWGQFFISSFAFDKKIEKGNLQFARLETYWGAFLTDFFSFFMIVATASTLFVHGLPITSGEQAAEAIKPLAGELAGFFFAIGILNAGFMGLVIVSLCTTYAFAEFFGLSGSLNDTFDKSKAFYILFIAQLLVATVGILVSGATLFRLAIITQSINAIMLPIVFFYLIRLTNSKEVMGEYANTPFQKYFSIICTVIITITSILAVGLVIFT